MSFNSEAKIIKNCEAPIGIRYISLRHCVQMFCPLGFHKTWSILAGRFGLKENEENSSEALSSSIIFLEEWREIHIRRKNAERQYIKSIVKLGLPKSAAI